MKNALVFLTPLVATLWACSEASRRPIGSTCDTSEECASGLCFQQSCIEPSADLDTDGLTNSVEVALGSDPRLADTDGDGIEDLDELGTELQLRDSDGDSRPDILESATNDADMDCVGDEGDPDDLSPTEGMRAELVADHCPRVGVCAAAGSNLAVTCPDGLDNPVCDFSGVADFAESDTSCDGVDDDCDGRADEDGSCGPYPNGCWAISSRVDGRYMIDFDGIGAEPPVEVLCLFSVEFGDWMRLDANVGAVARRLAVDEPREYLFRKGSAWFRSPYTTSGWDWNAGTSAAGLWISVGGDGSVGGFDCEAKIADNPSRGIGCVGSRVLEVESGDAATGTATVCDSGGGVFSSACEPQVEVYVRYQGCRPDDGQMLADGGFSGFATGKPCWYAVTNGVPMANFEFDSGDVRPEGNPPSLKGQNPRSGNIAREVEVGQSRFPVLAGRAYTLKFWARSTTERNVLVSLQQKEVLQAMFGKLVAIGPRWVEYVVDINATESTWNGQLTFGLGVTTEPVWLDDVQLIDRGLALPSPCDPPPGKFIANGDFSGPDHSCWEITSAEGMAVSTLDDFTTFPPSGTAPSLRVSQSPGTVNIPDVVLTQLPVKLPPMKRMRLSFWLKAAVPAWVGYTLTGGPYPGGFATEVGPDWKQFVYEFDSSLGTNEGSLQFQFGERSGADIWIDGVTIEEIVGIPR